MGAVIFLLGAACPSTATYILGKCGVSAYRGIGRSTDDRNARRCAAQLWSFSSPRRRRI